MQKMAGATSLYKYVPGLRICKARLMNSSLHKVRPEQESGARKSCPEQQYEQKKRLNNNLQNSVWNVDLQKSVGSIIL